MELMRAHEQWMKRPDDERFLTLESLYDATLQRANRCESRVIQNDHLELVGAGNGKRSLQVAVAGIDDPAEPTHWSFGQLCSRAKVDKRTARRTHPQIAADLLNYGLRFDEDQKPVRVDESNLTLHKLPSGELEMRCMVGPNYGRIYDHQVVGAIMALNADGTWHIPAGSTMTAEQAAKSKRATTLYASDRDVFVFLVDERRPLEINGDVLFRGFMVWNSEVGKTTLGISTFFYRHACDNRIIWGARDVRTMKIRHTSGAPERFERELKPALKEYAEASLEQTVKTIQQARAMEVDNAEEWLASRRNFTKAEAKKIVERAVEEEGECKNVWQIVQGGTAIARSIQHTDARVIAEIKVSKLLDLAENRVSK